MPLLERDAALAELRECLARALATESRLVVVEGEAGIGKTSLLRAFASQVDGAPLFWAACDALQTPRPLGPLQDIAAEAGDELAAALRETVDRYEMFGRFLGWLTEQPRIVLLEDVHWADEATLDLLRFCGRRIGRTRSLLVVSARDDETGPTHPLRFLFGDLATVGLVRLKLEPLSLVAVRELAGSGLVDVESLHRRTGGNPFFLTEVLATDRSNLPPTVRDAVLSRAARLRTSARAILDAAAVAGPRIEPWLLREVAGSEGDAIDECLDAGVLRPAATDYEFRHELARQAILAAIDPARLLVLHRMVLQALLSPGAPRSDPARLAHHADGAADGEAVLAWAVMAAAEASRRGAHRQAAEQYARALRYVTPGDPRRAGLLDEQAVELFQSGQHEAAIAAREEAAREWAAAGNAGRQAVSLARLATFLVIAGRNAESETVLAVALGLIADRPAEPAAMETLRWSAYLRMLDRDVAEAIRQGSIAMASAEQLGDREAVVQCLNVIGSSMIVADDVEPGLQHLERSLLLAQGLHSDYWVSAALGNLGSACGEAFRLDLAADYLVRGIDYCADRDLDHMRLYMSAWLATVEMYRGDWADAARRAQQVLDDVHASGVARVMSLIALGRIRARRGDPGAAEALDEAQAMVRKARTLQRLAPLCAARAEAAWLDGRAADIAGEIAPALDLAIAKQHPWFAAELLYWQRLSPADPLSVPEFCAGYPWSLETAGRWREAAAAWRARSCPWEAARALAGGDEDAQREALSTFDALGSAPMVEKVRRSLRAAGARDLPRGPRESTRRQPGGLTRKEIEVLRLLAQGLRSKDIAARLSRSVRTIDHHLAAIFAKLGTSTRSEAVIAAYRMGLVPEGDAAGNGSEK